MHAVYIILKFYCHIAVASAFLLANRARNKSTQQCLSVKATDTGKTSYSPVTTIFQQTTGATKKPGTLGNNLGGEVVAGSSREAAPSLEPVAELLGLKHKPTNPELKKSLVRTKLDWAEWEIRRFGYKLGTANKQMRKLAEQYKAMRNSFTSSKEDLDKIRKVKREVSVKLRIATRLRRLFITYRNGLLTNCEPTVPYVPIKYRSENAPSEFYAFGKRKYQGKKHKDLSGSTDISTGIGDNNTVDTINTKCGSEDKPGKTNRTAAEVEREILGLIAEANNQAVGKKGLINNPTIAKIQAKYRRRIVKMCPGHTEEEQGDPLHGGDSEPVKGDENPEPLDSDIQQAYGMHFADWQDQMQHMVGPMGNYHHGPDENGPHSVIQHLNAPNATRQIPSAAFQHVTDANSKSMEGLSTGSRSKKLTTMFQNPGSNSLNLPDETYAMGHFNVKDGLMNIPHHMGSIPESMMAQGELQYTSPNIVDPITSTAHGLQPGINPFIPPQFMMAYGMQPQVFTGYELPPPQQHIPRPKPTTKKWDTTGKTSASGKKLHPKLKSAGLNDPGIIDDDYSHLLYQMPHLPEEVISMAKSHITVDTEFLTSLGGIYKEYSDAVTSLQKKIIKTQKKLDHLYELMGRNPLAKQTDPRKLHDSAIWNLVLKEMQDFQDLVSYEHREKRKKYKAIGAATLKQRQKLKTKKHAVELDEIKNKRLSCKNVSGGVSVYWKKIERFAWERMKRDLQAALIEKKRLRLDKFVEDAIKISINKNDGIKRKNKSKKRQHDATEPSQDDIDTNKRLKLNDGTGSPKRDLEPEFVGMKIDINSARSSKGSIYQGDIEMAPSTHRTKVDEDEFVISDEMRKMEHDDRLLDFAMEKEELDLGSQKQEVNALEDDLNVPIEEILKRYQQEAELYKQEYGETSPGGTTSHSDGYTTDSMDVDEVDEITAYNMAQAASSLDNSIKKEPIETDKDKDITLGDIKKEQILTDTLSSMDANIKKEPIESDPKKSLDQSEDQEAEFTLADDMFKEQEDEDKHLDEAISDEHSDNEEGKLERAKEISALEEEADMPIEQLIAKYREMGGYDEMGDGMDQDSEQETQQSDMETDTKEAESADELASTATEDTSEEESEEENKIQVPSLIRAVLRPYQLEGLRWLASLYRSGSNGILADEMGLGKTLQTISLLAHLACEHGNWGPHLIVVPTSVLLNWEMEFKKFCPGFTILSYYGSPAERAKKRIGWNKDYAFNVCIASYATVVQDAFILKRKSWVYMVLDEAQNIKNFNSKRWQTLLTFNTQGRLLLTGTPLQNSLQELWSLMHFILPDIFTSHTEFKEWFSDPLTESIEREQMGATGAVADSQTAQLVKKLHTVLRPYLLRRLKKDVEKQMPSKYEHVIKCYLSRRQRVLYDEFITSRNAVEILKNPNYRSMLFVLMQLRKICNHPDQLQSRPVESPYYDPWFLEDVTIPSIVLLPEPRHAKLYHYEVMSIEEELPDALPITIDARGPLDRICVPQSFVKSYKSLKIPIDQIYKGCNNAYDETVVDLPIVSRFPIAKSLASRKSGGRRKLRLANSLIDSMLTTCPYSPVKRSATWRNGIITPFMNGRSDSMLITEVLNRNGSIQHDGVEMPLDSDKAFCDKRGVSIPSAQGTVEDVNMVDPNDNLLSTRHASMEELDDKVDGLKTPVGFESRSNMCVIVNRRELLEVNDSFFINRFTIEPKAVAKMETFCKIVNPTVDDLVERNWWMLSRFVCTTGPPIECNPRRVVMVGPGGPVWNRKQELAVARVQNRITRPSSYDYFRKHRYTIEHVRGLQKVLFPARSLLHDDCGKFLVLGRLLNRLKNEGHRCLLYTQFSKMLDILENWINYMGFTYVRLDGSTKVDMRQRIVTRFNENTKIFLFISSTRAGGVGLTLTGADTVIFYDTDWNPAMDRQAMDRCHRIGQTREVNVYRLISEHTVEENIWRKQLQKRRLDDIVVDKGNFDTENHNWFSNVDTLMNILKEQTRDGSGVQDQEDIYGKQVLHESEAPDIDAPRNEAPSRVVNMLAEAEDEDDATALKNRRSEAGSSNKDFQDFKGDLISSMPALVAYSIKLLLNYLTPTLVAQRDEMRLKIKVESLDSGYEDESSSPSELGSGSSGSEGGSEPEEMADESE
ncbi:DEAD-box family helicase [Babesia ovis]|uniref:DEAD-box family helicase n=1 Tax=Babesia ovis TaxID=5869 RepID=A0A9W5WUY7_BABOV|nr:DEAD-box family helicase [Babesia ovis]